MKIEKIDIQTSNKKHATDIAMLVDKPEFLREIQILREKWGITSLFRQADFFNFIDKYISGKNRSREFYSDISTLLEKFNRGINFKRVVEYVLVTGVVPEGVYLSCYFDTIPIGETDIVANPKAKQYVIVISPRTEKQELLEVFYEFQEHIRGYEPTHEFDRRMLGKINFHNHERNFNIENPDDKEHIEQYMDGSVYSAADITKNKTLKELERTREWYWIRYGDNLNDKTIRPLSYKKILELWQKNCPNNLQNQNEKDSNKHKECSCSYCLFYDINIIEQALASYIKLLNQS